MFAETKKVLIVARTYPTPARKGIEVSCTAGICNGEWIRLFPLPYRYLDEDQRFKKYQLIEVKVQKARSDARPESYMIFSDTISIKSEPLSSANDWQARKAVLFPLRKHCLCCLTRERDENDFPTLGFFRPKKIHELVIEKEENPTWTDEQLSILSQGNLFDAKQREGLEKVPYRFRYRFQCECEACTGHRSSVLTGKWERPGGDGADSTA